MIGIMCVLLHFAEPVVQGGWTLLEKVDPRYAQSNHCINCEDETLGRPAK
jgi:hypothetical protein